MTNALTTAIVLAAMLSAPVAMASDTDKGTAGAPFDAAIGAVETAPADAATHMRRARASRVGALNQARIIQNGNSNYFIVAQEGTGNLLEGIQQGDNNVVGAEQIGNGNAALIEQRGRGNVAGGLSQIGSGHMAVWRQYGENLGGLRITQTPGSPAVMVTQR